MFLNLKLAYSSLATHKFRAILAMLGVFLGAFAFTGVQHVSQMMVQKSILETEKLGPNLFAVWSGQVRFMKSGGIRFSGFARNFTLSDAHELLGGIPSVRSGVPVSTTTLPIRHGRNVVNAQISATWPQYQDVRSFHVDKGRFFTQQEEDERAKVCVLGVRIAERLFGAPEKSIGQTVYIYRAGFKVLGVMESKGRDLSGADQDEQVFVPLSTYMRRASNQNWISGVFMNIEPGADIEQVRQAATNIMRKRHNIGPSEDDDFSLLEATDTIKLQTQALDLVRTLGLISSTISFAVGGMGILSIMVLMVRARRLEIGIRRAVGCRRSSLVRQFIYESGLLAVTGGTAGVLTSLGLIVVFGSVTDFPLVIDPFLLIATLAGSAGIGLLAGAYPAWEASRIEILNVLDANG